MLEIYKISLVHEINTLKIQGLDIDDRTGYLNGYLNGFLIPRKILRESLNSKF